jgi:ACT domain-containing protein
MIELNVNLPDQPGTLIRMLKPISDYAGNISTVMHMHEEKKGNKVPVMVRFDLPENLRDEKLPLILKELKAQNIEVGEVKYLGVKLDSLVFIMVGHVFQTDFVDTFKRLNSIGGYVRKIEASFTEMTDVSNVKFEIEVDRQEIKKIMSELRLIAKEKNLTLITDR